MHTLKNVHSWTTGLEVEFDAVNQIRNIASLQERGKSEARSRQAAFNSAR